MNICACLANPASCVSKMCDVVHCGVLVDTVYVKLCLLCAVEFGCGSVFFVCFFKCCV